MTPSDRTLTDRPLDGVAQLLDRILATPADRQRAELDAACAAHPDDARELRRRFDALDALGLADPASDDALAIPDRIGEFELRERLGVGGMGIVFRAHQPALDRDVALKLIRPELTFFGDQRQRFRREAEAVARLDHPHIVPVFAVGEADGMPYLAMQLVDGPSLAEHLTELRRENGVRSAEATIRLLAPVADALAHAHARGIVHRDFKPSNVLLTRDGTAKLVDFGLASLDGGGSITRSGAVLGSAAYMSPEQVRGERADARSDVFAFGVVLYEALTLTSPFERGSSQATMREVAATDPPDIHRVRPELGIDLGAIVAKCLEKQPDRRYASAAELAADLYAVVDDRPVVARPLSRWGRVLRRTRREPLRAAAWAATAIAALTLAGAGGYVLAKQDEIRVGREQLFADEIERDLASGYFSLWRGERAAARATFEAIRARTPSSEADYALALLDGTPAAPAGPDQQFAAAMHSVFAGPRGDRAGARRAVEWLADAIVRDDRSRPLYRFALIYAATNAGDTATARRAAEALAVFWPDSAATEYWIGYALLDGDTEGAATHLRRAIELDPDFGRAHADLGAAELRLGNFGAAESALNRALELDQHNREAPINLGLLHVERGEVDRAIDLLERVCAAPDALPGAFYTLGLARGATAGAIDAYRQAVERDPAFADAWNNLGVLHFQRGELTPAIAAFAEVCRLRPEHPDGYRHLGSAHAAHGDAEAAASAYTRVVELAPDDRPAHDYLCQLLTHLGDTDALTAEKDRFAARRGHDK